MNSWSRLADLAASNFNNVPKSSGIYILRWSKEGKPVSIGRLNDTDDKGILYIGSTKILRNRVRKLWKAVNQKPNNHTISKTIIFCKVFDLIGLDEYEITWEELTKLKDARGQEWAAIDAYSVKHKEPPPLNLQLNRELFAKLGIAKLPAPYVYELDDFVKSNL